MGEPLIILGASARAAAQSAARAGFEPWCADLFGDADLAATCFVARIDRYPCGFPAAVREAPDGPWLYTGGLENYPAVVERIAAERTLLGNRREPLRRVRDPWQLAQLADTASLRSPELNSSGAQLPRDGSWLRKPLRSSGGLRIEIWNARNGAHPDVRGWYFQSLVKGNSAAAVFLAAEGSARLLGVTEQLVGGDVPLAGATRAPRFHYAGSVGPLELSAADRQRLEKLGNTLAATGLTGLFGVDLIIDEKNIWPIEVNPRFPASVEVLERCGNYSAVALHVAACRDHDLPPPLPTGSLPLAPLRYAGKAIYYADSDFELTQSYRARLDAGSHLLAAAFADVPAHAGLITAGQPLCTLLEYGTNADQVRGGLMERLNELRSELEPNTKP